MDLQCAVLLTTVSVCCTEELLLLKAAYSIYMYMYECHPHLRKVAAPTFSRNHGGDQVNTDYCIYLVG